MVYIFTEPVAPYISMTCTLAETVKVDKIKQIFAICYIFIIIGTSNKMSACSNIKQKLCPACPCVKTALLLRVHDHDDWLIKNLEYTCIYILISHTNLQTTELSIWVIFQKCQYSR